LVTTTGAANRIHIALSLKGDGLHTFARRNGKQRSRATDLIPGTTLAACNFFEKDQIAGRQCQREGLAASHEVSLHSEKRGFRPAYQLHRISRITFAQDH